MLYSLEGLQLLHFLPLDITLLFLLLIGGISQERDLVGLQSSPLIRHPHLVVPFFPLDILLRGEFLWNVQEHTVSPSLTLC